MDQQFWENYFLTYDLLNEAIPYQELMKDLIRVLEVEKGDLIFDAGSGTGNLSILLKKYGAQPIGYDFSEKAIKIHLMKDPDAEVYFADLRNELPFPDNYYDKVVSINVIYTIDRRIRLSLFKEFYRVLKIKGKCVIANVHTGFNPFIILKDHINHSLKIKGIKKTAIDITTKHNAIGNILYHNYLLVRKNRRGKYAFVEKNEQRYLLTKAGFRNIADTISAYSNQSYIDVGIK